MMTDVTKLLYVTGTLYPWEVGGPPVSFRNIVSEISGDPKYDVNIYATSNKKLDDVYIYHNKNSKFKLARQFHRSKDVNSLFSHIQYTKFSLSEKTNYDIIHFDIVPGAKCYIPFKILRKKFPDSKFVMQMVGMVPYELYLNSSKNILHQIHWKLAESTFNQFDCIVVKSRFMREFIKNGIEKPDIRVIPNGINLDEWKPKEKIELKGEFNIAFWGILHPLKGVDSLIKAFSMCDNVNVHLYIAGDGPFKKNYIELVNSLGLQDKVTFTGYLNHQSVSILAHSVDFCVFPSLYEAFGNMILEAMACGKPVITLKDGGPQDIITHGKDGFLINPRNPKEISEKINMLLRNTELIRNMGCEASKTVQKFQIKNIGEQYKKLYADLLDRD